MNRRPSGLAVSKALSGFLQFKSAEGISPRTMIAYEHDLKLWIEYQRIWSCPKPVLRPLDVDHLQAYHPPASLACPVMAMFHGECRTRVWPVLITGLRVQALGRPPKYRQFLQEDGYILCRKSLPFSKGSFTTVTVCSRTSPAATDCLRTINALFRLWILDQECPWIENSVAIPASFQSAHKSESAWHIPPEI